MTLEEKNERFINGSCSTIHRTLSDHPELEPNFECCYQIFNCVSIRGGGWAYNFIPKPKKPASAFYEEIARWAESPSGKNFKGKI